MSEAGLRINENLDFDKVLQEMVDSARGLVWGGKGDDVRPLHTIVDNLRRKLGDEADYLAYIFAEPRVGYRMPEGKAREEPR